jgi:hypothetical protein
VTTTTQTEWTLHEAAEQLIERLIEQLCERSPFLAALTARLPAETSTRLFDWLDHLAGPVSAADLTAAGYVDGYRTAPGVWRHPGAQLPAIVPDATTWQAALRVDDCAAFASAHASTRGVRGAELSGFRQAVVIDDGVVVSGVERRSWAGGISTVEWAEDPVAESRRAWRLWAERPRTWGSSADVLDLVRVAEEMVALVGPDLAASYALELERAYWQRRNTAAVLQHARQDRLGLGWGNNDHHTFRSSRVCFAPLIQVFRALGFSARERFYAGAEAGWGAQVMEHPGNGGVIFADVDLTPDEVAIDFAAQPLPPGSSLGLPLGTVGLWCALHGESVLVAGMHHLEGQFEFDQLRTALTALGVGQLAPFSNFPHLRQAFTEAERWPVPRSRLEPLVAAGELTAEKAEEFATRGAAGSHLENLARRAGFKGFNQANVSTTMRATDPRIL